MKSSVICVFIIALSVFGLYASAQENQDTASQPPRGHQRMDMPRQGHGNTNDRKMMDGGMMDCSGCMMNHVLIGSSKFYIDMQNSLGLTDTQVDKLHEIRLDYTKRTVDLQGELRISRLELQDMLVNDAVEIDDVDRKIRDTYDLEAELQVEKIRSIIEARNVLTPSQREQVTAQAYRGTKSPGMSKGHMQSY